MEGETLICDKDTRGYNFISKDKVKFSDINLNNQATIHLNINNFPIRFFWSQSF
jgi:hypothetical protein